MRRFEESRVFDKRAHDTSPRSLEPIAFGIYFLGRALACRTMKSDATAPMMALVRALPSQRYVTTRLQASRFALQRVTVQERMQHVSHTDRRFSQTRERYAADDLAIMREARRYTDHVFGLVRPHLGSKVLEVGCGIGTISRHLVDVADFVLGIEPNLNCASRTQEVMDGHPRFSLRVCHLEDCDPAELARFEFDSILCVNVLEHIADHIGALKTLKRTLPAGGRVLVFVPAIQAAYGPLDAELGHHRRYSADALRCAFAKAQIEVVDLRYTNPIGLLAWMYNAHVRKATSHSLAQVKLFETLVAPWALPLERLIRPPIGLSLLAVGQV